MRLRPRSIEELGWIADVVKVDERPLKGEKVVVCSGALESEESVETGKKDGTRTLKGL